MDTPRHRRPPPSDPARAIDRMAERAATHGAWSLGHALDLFALARGLDDAALCGWLGGIDAATLTDLRLCRRPADAAAVKLIAALWPPTDHRRLAEACGVTLE